MRFEKISENKLKIILSNDELPNSNNLDNFMSDSKKAKDSFIELLDEAKMAVGFNAEDYKIKVDAKAMMNGEYVFIITRLVKLKHGHRVVKPKPVLNNKCNYKSAIYQFENLDDFYDFCSYLKYHKINYLNNLCKFNTLYKYGGKYYLYLNQINKNYKKLAMFYTSITEFSKFFSSKEMFTATLKEHGDKIIDRSAIFKTQKML